MAFNDQFAVSYTIVTGCVVWEDDAHEFWVQLEVCHRIEKAHYFRYDADFGHIAANDREREKLERGEDWTPTPRLDIPVSEFRGATQYYTNTINMPTGTKFVFADPGARKWLVRELLQHHGMKLEKEQQPDTMFALQVRIFELMAQLAQQAEQHKFQGSRVGSVTCSMARGAEKLDVRYEVMKLTDVKK